MAFLRRDEDLNMKKATSIKIGVFSFIGTLIIAAYHLELVFYNYLSVSDSTHEILVESFEYIACVAMSFFFMKSGFLLYRNATKENIGAKLKRRLFTLFVPFFLWNLPFLFIKLFQQFILHFDSEISIKKVILKLTLFPYNGPLWYVFAIGVLCFIAPIILIIKEHKKMFMVMVGSVLALSIFIYGFNGLRFFIDLSDSNQAYIEWIERFFRYLPCYMVGSLLGMSNHEHFLELKTNKKNKLCLICMSIIISIVWIGFRNSLANYIKLLFLFVQPYIIWIIIDERLFDNDKESEAIKCSFLIYAIHGIILNVITHILEKKPLYELLPFSTTTVLYNATIIILPVIFSAFICVICIAIRKLLLFCKLKSVLSVLTGSRG